MILEKNRKFSSPEKEKKHLKCEDIISLQVINSKCTLMTEGYKPSKAIFYFCFCDPDCQSPLCENCVKTCHGNHWKNRTFEEIEAEERVAICHCGMKNHSLNEGDLEKDFLFKEDCLFCEWAATAKTYVYYENAEGETYCSFCMSQCQRKKNENFIKKRFDKLEQPKCQCNKHDDFNKVLDNFAKLFLRVPFEFEGMSIQHFIKMVMKSESSFKNTFYNMNEIVEKIALDIYNSDFSFELYANNSHFMKALEKIELMASNCGDLYYFSNTFIDCSKIIFNFLRKKFDYASANNVWLLKKYLFNIYHKFIFRSNFEDLPVISEKDIQNLNPFQRLMCCEYFNRSQYKKKYMQVSMGSVDQKNIIDSLLKILEKYKNIKTKNDVYFEILQRIYSELKRFIRFNQLSQEQIRKFLTLNDDLIYNCINSNSNDFKTETSQMVMLNQMVKCVMYLSFYYNDVLFKQYLLNELSLPQCAFFHCDNEIAKMIYKNCTHILLYCRTIHRPQVSTFTSKNSARQMATIKFVRNAGKTIHYHNEIMFTATGITSLTLNYPDAYLVGMRRIMEKDKEIYLDFINGNYENNEIIKSRVEFLYEMCDKMEGLYRDFFDFKSNAEVFQNEIIKIIEDVFSKLQINYNFDVVSGSAKVKNRDIGATLTKNTTGVDKTKSLNFLKKMTLRKKNAPTEEQKLNEKRNKILINKTPFIFTLVKALRILIKCTKNDNDDKTINQNFIDSLFRLLFYYVSNNMDNCIMMLSSNIMSSFFNMPIMHIEQLLNFIIFIIKQLIKNSITLVNVGHVIKLMKNIIERTCNKNEYVLIFDDTLRVISKLSKISYLNEEHTINKLRKMIKRIYIDNPILSEFRDTLYDLNTKKNEVNLISQRKEEDDITTEENNKDKLLYAKSTLNNLIINKSALKGYQISMLTRLFKNYLKIVNVLFNDNATLNEGPFLNQILTRMQVLRIISDKTLYFPLRIEIVKFFRIAYINMMIDNTKLTDYLSIIVNDIPKQNEKNTDNFIFFNDLLNIKENDKNSIILEGYLLRFELTNFEEIVKDITFKKKIYQYLEEGIILPLCVFVNKFMSIIYTVSGAEYLDFYHIIYYFLKLKQFLIVSNSNDKQGEGENTKFRFSNLLLNLINVKKNKFSLIFQNMDDVQIKDLEHDIQSLDNLNKDVFGYKKLFSLFDKHIKGFIKKPPSKFLKELFSKKSIMYTEEEIINREKEYRQHPFTEKIFTLITKYENDKVNFAESSLSINLGEKNILYDATYRSIMLRPMFFLINTPGLYIKYRRQNLWHIFRLLQYDTSGTQNDILSIYNSDKMNGTPHPTININYLCGIFIKNFLSVIFSSCNPNATSTIEDYTIAYMVIKILKYLCEDHNTKFQSIFFQDIKIEYGASNVCIFELMMCTLNKIVTLAQWDKVGFGQEEDNISYFYEIFFVMIEFSIEMIQGTTKSNLERIISVPGKENENSLFYKFLLNVKDIITNDDNDSEIVYNVRLDLINFIVAFLEEKKTPEKLINLLGTLFNPLTIFNSIVNTLKKLYIKLTNTGSIRNYKTIEFDNKKCKTFITMYFESSELSQCKEFELANRMYNYVKLLTTFGNKDAERLIDSISIYKEDELVEIYKKHNESKGKDDENVMIDQNFTQNFFAVKFFEQITRSVWIQGEVKKPQMVLFTLDPTVMFLSEDTKNIFYRTVPRDNRSSKLFGLMEYCLYFFLEINHNKKRLGGNFFLKYLNTINYKKIESWLFVITVIINLIIFLKVKNTDSDDNYKKVYDIVMPIGIIQVLLNLLCLVCWIVSKFSLYFVIEKEKYYLENKINKEEESLTITQTLYIMIFKTMLSKKEIISFLWNIIFSLIASSKSTHIFLFSIQLLIIVNISSTIQNIILAVVLRYKQLLVTFLFLFICMYIFSCLAFFFFSKDYVKTLEENQENACGTLLYCFLTHMNFGLRTDGGIGEFMQKNNFFESPGYFMGVFFFQFFFFIIIIIIILSMLGGIIIDTVAELREKSRANFKDMNNVCFICNGDQNSIEKKGENFTEHINKKHHIWTYVDYMIGLKFVDPQETNAINSFVIEKIEQKKISWFPSFSNSLDEEEDDEDEDDNEGEDNMDIL